MLEKEQSAPDEGKVILDVDQGARYSLQDRRAAIGTTCTPLGDGVLELVLPSKVTAQLRADNPDATYNRLYFDVLKIKDNKASRVIHGEIHVSPGSAHREAVITT